MARRYTPQEKAQALKLYEQHGPSEAGRRTGIPSGTIRQWAKRSGVTVTRGGSARASVEAARLSWAQRRAELTVRSGEAAAHLLEKVLAAKSPKNARLLAATYAIIVDRAQLLDGAATARTETRDLTSMAEDAIDEVLAARGDEPPAQR